MSESSTIYLPCKILGRQLLTWYLIFFVVLSSASLAVGTGRPSLKSFAYHDHLMHDLTGACIVLGCHKQLKHSSEQASRPESRYSCDGTATPRFIMLRVKSGTGERTVDVLIVKRIISSDFTTRYSLFPHIGTGVSQERSFTNVSFPFQS